MLESDTARERIRLELRSPNPNTGLYREYAAVGVHLNPERIDLEPVSARGATARSQGESPELELEGLDEDEFSPPEIASGGGRTGTSRSTKAGPDGGGSDAEVPRAAVEDPRVGANLVGGQADAPGEDPLANVPQACPDCAADLPARENLRFCPFCGTNVFVKPCGDCGEVLERDWRFCIACGVEAA